MNGGIVPLPTNGITIEDLDNTYANTTNLVFAESYFSVIEDSPGRILLQINFPTPPPPTPGGDTGELQWNNAGTLDGTDGVTYSSTGTRLTVSGGSISCPGTGANSQRFGAGATAGGVSSGAFMGSAPGANSYVFGPGNTGTGGSVFIFGNADNSVNNYANIMIAGLNATATNNNAVAVGPGASCGDSAFAGGNAAMAVDNTVAIGGNASATHAGAVSIGRVATSEANGDITLGGFGSSAKQFRVVGPSDSNFSRDHWRVESQFTSAIDATRRSQAQFFVWGNGTKVEAFRIAGSAGGLPAFGFMGAAAVIRQTIVGSRADPEQALAALLTALATAGLIVDGTTT